MEKNPWASRGSLSGATFRLELQRSQDQFVAMAGQKLQRIAPKRTQGGFLFSLILEPSEAALLASRFVETNLRGSLLLAIQDDGHNFIYNDIAEWEGEVFKFLDMHVTR